MVDQNFFVYTPSTAELSAVWLKMLMIDLDNIGRILEYTYLLNKMQSNVNFLPSEPEKLTLAWVRHLLILT